MNKYQCWFCGEDIDQADDGHAVMIAVESLWRWDAGLKSDDAPWQAIYSHSACVRTRLSGATMDLEPDLLGDDE